MKNDKIVLYMHAGSDNHGCEAIANTLIKMLSKPAVLISSRKAEDEKYSLQGLCSQIILEKYIEKNMVLRLAKDFSRSGMLYALPLWGSVRKEYVST